MWHGDTDQAARSYSPQIRTNSSRWWGPKMDESLVRYSKLSMITATNRFSIWTGQQTAGQGEAVTFIHMKGEPERLIFNKRLFGIFWNPESPSYQEGTEENERDKVEISKVGATAALLVRRLKNRRVPLALLSPQTRQHDLLPWLPRSTPGHARITQHRDEEEGVCGFKLSVYSQVGPPSGKVPSKHRDSFQMLRMGDHIVS